MTYLVMAGLVLSHMILFMAGAMAYHLVRILAARPIYKTGGGVPDEKRLQALAEKILRKEMSDTQFAHLRELQKENPGRPITVEEDIPFDKIRQAALAGRPS